MVMMLKKVEREREREFYFTPAKPGCGHMAATSEGGMSLRLRGEEESPDVCLPDAADGIGQLTLAHTLTN